MVYRVSSLPAFSLLRKIPLRWASTGTYTLAKSSRSPPYATLVSVTRPPKWMEHA